MRHAAWILLITFALSFTYELYRATIKAGVSRHDSLRTFVSQGLPLYVVATIVIAMLFVGFTWAAWVGLVFAVALILVSIFYYNPRIMLERRPGLIDWFEDLVYTGLLFVAAALLLYDVLGKTLAP
jgi:phosphatidylserine synthase